MATKSIYQKLKTKKGDDGYLKWRKGKVIGG